MKIINTLNLKNFKLNKRRNIATIIGIMLSVALITCVTSMFVSLKETIRLELIAEGGDYNYATVNSDKFDKVKTNNKIKYYFSAYRMPRKNNNENENSVNLAAEQKRYNIAFVSKNDYDKFKLKYASGRAPEANNEIALPIWAKSNEVQIGSKVELKEVSDTEYTVVGFYSSSAVNLMMANAALLNEMPQGKTFEEILFFRLKNMNTAKETLASIFTEDEIDSLASNYSLNKFETLSLSNKEYLTMIIIVGAFILIIMVSSIFIIRNSFAISVTEKTKEFGILKSLGATTSQIRKLIIAEGRLLGVFGTGLGLLLGVLATFILIQIINSLLAEIVPTKIVFYVSLLGIIISVLLSAITIYVSVVIIAWRARRISAIEAIRSSKDIKIKGKKLRTPKIIQKMFGIGGVIAYKNLKRSRKKYRTTIISITVSVMSFLLVNYGVSALITSTKNILGDFNMNYGFQFYSMNEKNKEEILSTLGEIKNTMSPYGELSIRSDMIGEIEASAVNHKTFGKAMAQYGGIVDTASWAPVDIVFMDNESFNAVLSQNRLPAETKAFTQKFAAIKDRETGARTVDEVIIKDKVALRAGEFRYPEDSSKRITVEVNVAKIEKLPSGASQKFTYYPTVYLRSGDKDFEKLESQTYKHQILGKVKKESEASNKTQEILNKKEATIGSFTNYYEQLRLVNNLILLVQIFGYGFILVMTGIGLTNIFNTITTNVLTRKQEFATLNSIGLTKKEFNKIISLESLFYGMKALFFGLSFGIALTYVVFTIIHREDKSFVYELPILAILISIVFVFVIIRIIMQYSVNLVNKQNIIETIRNENI